MTDDGRGFRSTRDAEICVCGLARAEHHSSGKFAGLSKSDKPFCAAFRTSNPTIPNPAHFREVCEHPEKYCGLKWNGGEWCDASPDR